VKCYYCATEISTEKKITRQQTCPSCGNPLHCCRNCRFFDENAYHQCRETEAEWVSDKASANFCDYFEPGSGRAKQKSISRDEADAKLKEMLKRLESKDEDESA
jgi:hypothetical protein